MESEMTWNAIVVIGAIVIFVLLPIGVVVSRVRERKTYEASRRRTSRSQ